MKRTHKVGSHSGWKAMLRHTLTGALLVMLLSQGGVVAASDKSMGVAATDVVAAISGSVRGVIDAGARVVRDLHQIYQINKLRDIRVENEAAPAPAPVMKLCKAKAAPALPAMDKSRS